jgi:hypothetical protein
MKILILGMVAVAAAPTLPTGTWRQASDGTEIVLDSTIKLTPSGNWGGTSLGGSVGYGSMTTTRVVVEPTPKRVTRSMALTIGVDGDFDWMITRRFADAKGCMRTVRQHKVGRASMAGGAVVFAVQRGEEEGQGCGSDATKAIAAGVERYALSHAAGSMTLSGPGGVRWQFHR